MRRGSARGGIDPIGDLIGRQLGSLQITRKIKEHTAPIVWAEVVGEQIAGATQILGVEGGVLRVSTKSSVWAHELTYYKKDLLRRLNQKLEAPENAPVILDLHFQNRGIRPVKESDEDAPAPGPTLDELDAIALSPGELRTIEDGILPISDPRLRNRLRETRLRDARLRTWRLDSGWIPCPACGELVVPLPTEAGGPSCPRCRTIRR